MGSLKVKGKALSAKGAPKIDKVAKVSRGVRADVLRGMTNLTACGARTKAGLPKRDRSRE